MTKNFFFASFFVLPVICFSQIELQFNLINPKSNIEYLLIKAGNEPYLQQSGFLLDTSYFYLDQSSYYTLKFKKKKKIKYCYVKTGNVDESLVFNLDFSTSNSMIVIWKDDHYEYQIFTKKELKEIDLY